MEKGHDYLPQGDEDFLEWSRNFVEGVEENAEVLGAPASEVTTLRTQFNDYETKLRVAKSGNRGKADVAKKNEAKKVLMRTERLMNKLYIAWNPRVDNALRKALGVTVHDAARTPVPKPKTRPEFNFKVLDIMRIQIGFHEQGIASRAIPYGYNGAVFCYIVADTPVTDYNLLTNSILLTYSPWTLVLPPDAEGKVLSGAMMWQNGKGERGPWSEIQSIIVP